MIHIKVYYKNGISIHNVIVSYSLLHKVDEITTIGEYYVTR